jgi:hypothetical protein
MPCILCGGVHSFENCTVAKNVEYPKDFHALCCEMLLRRRTGLPSIPPPDYCSASHRAPSLRPPKPRRSFTAASVKSTIETNSVSYSLDDDYFYDAVDIAQRDQDFYYRQE